MRRALSLALLAAAATISADECADQHAGCADWAAAGECDKNPGFMRSSCEKSCDACPEPLDPALTELGPEQARAGPPRRGRVGMSSRVHTAH